MSATVNQASTPTSIASGVVTYKVLVDGQEISGAYHLLSVMVSLEVNRISSAVLHFKDGEAAKQTFEISNTPDFVPGKSIEIKLGYNAQEKSVFKGVVIKQSIKIRASGSQLVVECKDKAIEMTLTRRSQYYNDQKESEVWEELIGRHGLAKDVMPTTQKFHDVVQYNTTDWDFLVCRADAHGMFVTLENGKVRIAPPDLQQPPALVVQYGSALLELDAEMDARTQSESLKAYSWDAANLERVEAEAKDSTGTPNGNISAKDLAQSLHHSEQLLYHGGALTTPELQAWANAQMLRNRLAKVRGRACFQGFADLKPTQILEIKGIGQRFEGKVFVAGVRHQLSGGNWETDVQFGLNPLPFAEQYHLTAPQASALRPAVGGLQIGIVTKLEGDPDGEERIKIKLPMVSTETEGTWARIATLDAGKERGMYFRPEIGDEVIVGFMNDDPNYPVVLGMCHSSNHPAPTSPKDDNHEKGYVSRSKMKWVFDDDKKSISIETPAGNKIVISEDEKSILIQDQNSNKIQMDSSGIQIESSKDLVLKATKDIKIEGMNMTLKAKTNFKAEGSATAEMAGANVSVKGSAATVIKGGIVQIN
jgi:Rhs element Vgr protein